MKDGLHKQWKGCSRAKRSWEPMIPASIGVGLAGVLNGGVEPAWCLITGLDCRSKPVANQDGRQDEEVDQEQMKC